MLTEQLPYLAGQGRGAQIPQGHDALLGAHCSSGPSRAAVQSLHPRVQVCQLPSWLCSCGGPGLPPLCQPAHATASCFICRVILTSACLIRVQSPSHHHRSAVAGLVAKHSCWAVLAGHRHSHRHSHSRHTSRCAQSRPSCQTAAGQAGLQASPGRPLRPGELPSCPPACLCQWHRRRPVPHDTAFKPLRDWSCPLSAGSCDAADRLKV